MPIGTICNREVVVAQKGTTIEKAAQLMRQHHVGDLVIIEERNGNKVPVGVLTDRDLVIEILAAGVAPGTVSVGDVMSADIVTGHESDGIWETLQRMRVKGIRRMPVVDKQGGLAGIMTLDDLLELLASELNDLSKIIGREQNREKGAKR